MAYLIESLLEVAVYAALFLLVARLSRYRGFTWRD